MCTLFLYIRTLLVLISVLLFAGCTNFSQYATQLSNKNPDAVKSADVKSGGQNSKCNTWCHNGWCSTHCEDAS